VKTVQNDVAFKMAGVGDNRVGFDKTTENQSQLNNLSSYNIGQYDNQMQAYAPYPTSRSHSIYSNNELIYRDNTTRGYHWAPQRYDSYNVRHYNHAYPSVVHAINEPLHNANYNPNIYLKPAAQEQSPILDQTTINRMNRGYYN